MQRINIGLHIPMLAIKIRHQHINAVLASNNVIDVNASNLAVVQ